MAISVCRQGLAMTYFRTSGGADEFECAIDQAGAELESPGLLRCDQIVVAACQSTGLPLGVLGAARTAENGLELKTLHFAPHASDTNLITRQMLAFAILCIAQCGDGPRVIVSSAPDRGLRDILRDIGAHIRGAACFPDPGNPVVSLAAAALAAKICPRMIPGFQISTANTSCVTVLDLRRANDNDVLARARAVVHARAGNPRGRLPVRYAGGRATN